MDAGGVPGFLLGEGGQQVIETVTKDLSDLLGTPLVSDYVTQQRAISGFSATMDLVGAMAPQTEDCAARLTQILATDPAAAAAAAIAWPDLAQGKAAIDPSAGAVVNNFQPVFSSTTLTVNPDYSVVINDIDQAKTDINAAITASTETVTQAIAAAQTQLNQILDIQKTATGGQQDILKLLQGQALSAAQAQAVETARAQAAATLTATWQAAHGIVTGAAAIASLFGDTALARQITQVGSAVITVAQSVAGLVDAAANLSKVVNAVSALGTAAATGNIIGAVVGLLQLFAPSQPSPEAQILTQIGQLQKSIDGLHQDMSANFQLVDVHLDQIYTDLSSTLNQVATVANLTYEQVTELQGQLVAQEIALTQLGVALTAYMQAAERQQLLGYINAGLDYQAQNNGQAMTQAQFNDFSAGFFTWATETCRDDINQPLQGRDTSNPALATELAGNLCDNVSFLNRVLNARHLPSLMPDTEPTSAFAPLPNPQLWALAAQSYAQLSSEWPQLGSPDGTRQQAIVATGQQYSAARAKLAVDTSLMPGAHSELPWTASRLSAPPSTPTPARGSRPRYSAPNTVMVRETRRRRACDRTSWAMLPRSSPGHPSCSHSPSTSTSTLPLACPDGILNLIPPEIRLAEWFQPSHNFEVRAYASQVTKDEWIIAPETHKRSLETVLVGWSLGWWVNYAGVASVGTCSVDITADVQNAFGSINQDGQPTMAKYVAQHWEQGFKARLAQAAATQAVLASPSSLPASLAPAIAADLASARSDFYAWIPAQLTATGLCATQAAAVTGSRALLENVTRLLLPEPRAHDDALTAVFDGADTRGGALLADISALSALTASLDPSSPPTATWVADAFAASVQAPCAILADRLAAWVAAITAGQYSNPDSVIDQTLARLNLVDLLVQVAQASAMLPYSVEALVTQLPILAQGASGPAVRRAQGLLRAALPALGDASLSIDGQFGPQP